MGKLFLNSVLLYNQRFKVVFLSLLNYFEIKETESSLDTLHCILAFLDLRLKHLAHDFVFAFEGLGHRSMAAIAITCRAAVEH